MRWHGSAVVSTFLSPPVARGVGCTLCGVSLWVHQICPTVQRRVSVAKQTGYAKLTLGVTVSVAVCVYMLALQWGGSRDRLQPR